MSLLNRFTAIIILLVSLISGQKYDDRRNTDFTFKEAINRYNRSEFLETKYILSNLPYSEEEYYKEDVQLLLMRTEYQLNNFSESMTLGKTFLRGSSFFQILPMMYLLQYDGILEFYEVGGIKTDIKRA